MMEWRREILLGYLRRKRGISHGLYETGRAISPRGSERCGVDAIWQAEREGLLRVIPCTHGLPYARDVVLADWRQGGGRA